MSEQENETESENGAAGDGKAGARSETTYPAYGLEEGIRFAEAVQQAGGNEATEDDVRSRLGLASKTSRAWSYRLSSARAFGLVERAGRGDDARIKTTELFERYSMPGNDAEKQAAKMEALLRPPLYKKLMDRYRGAPVPDATGLGNILRRNHGLLDSVKGEAAEAFISSLRFAGAISNNKVVGAAESGTPAGGDDSKRNEREDPPKPPETHQKSIHVPATFIPHVFQLRRDMMITVPLPPDLSVGDVARLHKWLLTLPIEETAGPS